MRLVRLCPADGRGDEVEWGVEQDELRSGDAAAGAEGTGPARLTECVLQLCCGFAELRAEAWAEGVKGGSKQIQRDSLRS